MLPRVQIYVTDGCKTQNIKPARKNPTVTGRSRVLVLGRWFVLAGEQLRKRLFYMEQQDGLTE